MEHNSHAGEGIEEDLAALQIDIEQLDSITVNDVKSHYRKVAKLTHPDKADPTNLEQVERFTAAFQELGNTKELRSM